MFSGNFVDRWIGNLTESEESVDGFIHQLWKSYIHDALRAYNLSFLTVVSILICNANDENSDEKRER